MYLFIICLLPPDYMLHEHIRVGITVFSVPRTVSGTYMALNNCLLNKSLNHTTPAATFVTAHVVTLRNKNKIGLVSFLCCCDH